MDIHMDIQIFPPSGEEEHRWLAELWHSDWGGDTMVSRGHVYHLADLKQLVAKVDGKPVGAATYRFDAARQDVAVGTKLLAAVEDEARKAGCHGIWLITSNDNLHVLRFYQ